MSSSTNWITQGNADQVVALVVMTVLFTLLTVSALRGLGLLFEWLFRFLLRTISGFRQPSAGVEQ